MKGSASDADCAGTSNLRDPWGNSIKVSQGLNVKQKDGDLH
jgi:hypothetical protein